MGKTNLLDAIYYSCIGKSYFSSRDKNVANKISDFFRIQSTFDIHEVLIKVKPGKLKSIEVDDVKLEKISDHIGTLPVVMIAPIDIQILLEGSEPRRHFMNNTIGQYSKEYINHLFTYNRLLKQRNALLKLFQEKKYFDPSLLEAISIKMIEPAGIIHNYREEFINKLIPIFNQVYHEISGGSEEAIIKYKSPLMSDSFENILKNNIEKDRILARTSAGIHKDDIEFILNDDHLKTFASQGQLKSFVLALKLAQYQILNEIRGIKPILLLDDLFDKLDKNRVTYLLELLIKEPYCQVLISDTSKSRVSDILNSMNVAHQVIEVNQGVIL
jgi:DNA replication and repair protein RecF